MKEYKESRHWDLNISLKELIESNKDCKLDINYRRHKSDDCYGQFMLYFTHPQHPDRPYDIEIGIAEDGFVYAGNGGSTEEDKIVDIKQAMRFMEKYGTYLNGLNDFVSELGSIGVEQDCINTIYELNYGLEHKHSKKLTFRD